MIEFINKFDYFHSWYSLCWWILPGEISSGQRFSTNATESLFFDKNLPSECRSQWRNLRQHIEKGLETRFGHKAHSFGKIHAHIQRFGIKCVF